MGDAVSAIELRFARYFANLVRISPSTGGYEKGQISCLHFLLSGRDYSRFSAARIPDETIPPAAALHSPVVSSKPLLFSLSFIIRWICMKERFTSVQFCEAGEQQVFPKLTRKQATR